MDFGIKKLSVISLLCGFSLGAEASNIVYLPAYCEPSALTLLVENKSKEPQRVWTQVRFDEEIEELHHDLEAQSQLKIRGTSFLPFKMAASVKSFSSNIHVTASCEESASTPLSPLTSPVVNHYLPAGTTSVKLHLLNLFPTKNEVHLKSFNRDGSLVAERTVFIEKYYDTETIKWSLQQEISRIEVSARERVHSFLFYDSKGVEKPSPAIVSQPVALTPVQRKTYFLVSTKEVRPDEAFVIALDDDEQIRVAREQIRNPVLEKIIVGGIQLGHGGFNRAFLSKDKSPYSWSVHRVDAFADFAHIDCDGSPDLTEERLLQKLNQGGRICFWRYRVVRELTLDEVQKGRLKP